MEKCSNKKCSKVLKEGDGRYRIFDQTYCKDCFIKENRKQKIFITSTNKKEDENEENQR